MRKMEDSKGLEDEHKGNKALFRMRKRLIMFRNKLNSRSKLLRQTIHDRIFAELFET